MKVTVQFYAQLGEIVGARSRTFDLEAPNTAQDLVRGMADEYGGDFRRFLMHDDGSPRPSVLLFLAGRQIEWDAGDVLCEGDEVLLVPPIAGG